MTPTDPDSYDTLGYELDESFTGQEHTPRPEESEISVIFDWYYFIDFENGNEI